MEWTKPVRETSHDYAVDARHIKAFVQHVDRHKEAQSTATEAIEGVRLLHGRDLGVRGRCGLASLHQSLHDGVRVRTVGGKDQHSALGRRSVGALVVSVQKRQQRGDDAFRMKVGANFALLGQTNRLSQSFKRTKGHTVEMNWLRWKNKVQKTR